ncbi:MAG: alpha-N-acetylglucosaminidase C-terminal domain-containing protein [Bacteroidales bacterium]|nr:alpha-N-acetylglucosaminidase C-terminal domain-containing protein [Bacteroidales bacterium]
MRKILLLSALIAIVAVSCQTPAEKAAAGLAARIAPQYNIVLRQIRDTAECYRILTEGKKLVVEGSTASAMAVGLNRYLNDYCHSSVSWDAEDEVCLPQLQPAVPAPVSGTALVPKRFFLNYCTFGYTMPWWRWKEWERLIDWMALNGVNMPLASTGAEAVQLEVWRQFGIDDTDIRSWFTGPAHLPWHRMCNIDGVDGPLPKGWIDGQQALQKKILRRERELGMRPVLPAFAGHVPAQLKHLFPQAQITAIDHWGGFGKENLPYFLSPEDSLYPVIQKAFLEIQTKKYGTDHVYGFDLFNEVDPPSWEPEELASYGRRAYESVASSDPAAEWLQMGWMFHYDRRHWTEENVRAYLTAIPKGRVTLLDYYTEHTPVWELTNCFHGQPYIFCYLGNFGGNTRLAGPFRKEAARMSDALSKGGAQGIGCTLEGFGINRWMYEYVLSRAWNTGITDDEWLSREDLLHGAPEGFWKDLADSIYLRGSISEGPLLCGRPCLDGFHDWRVIHHTPYNPASLERLFKRLRNCPGANRADVVTLGIQVLANRFAPLRDSFTEAYRKGDKARARSVAKQMHTLLEDLDCLAGELPRFRLDKWLRDAESWAASPEEKYYYRHNAFHLITTWGTAQNLNDYASRVWNGLISGYYSKRWELFTGSVLKAMDEGRPFDQEAFDRECSALEKELVTKVSIPRENDTISIMTYNVGVFSKYGGNSLGDIAQLIKDSGAVLVSLNELDSCNRRHPVFQLEELSLAAGGLDFHFARALDFAGGAYGNGILSREPILWRGTIPLPKADGAEPRSAAVVETASCVFASAHLDHVGKQAQLEQVRLMSRWFNQRYVGCSKPVILCGDMNAIPDSKTIALLEKDWTRLTGEEFTYSTDNPQKCIDYIFALKSAAPVQFSECSVLTDSTTALSDHFPVFCRIGLLRKQ